ncbi:MAG: hypothetical protein PVH61_34505 [Candidatus Aminicenantes bacterium]|jgi:hypothetical protein
MKKILFPVFLMSMLLTVTAMSTGAPPAGNAKGDNYIFIFQVARYDLNIADAVDFIFNNIIKPEDSLTIFTPVKSYSFSKNTRKTHPQKKLIDVTKKVLKRDITIGTADYNRMLGNMAQLIRDLSDAAGETGTDSSISITGSTSLQGASTIKNIMVNYRQLLDTIRIQRKLDGPFFLGLAQTCKNLKGKNYLYILYQKELRPIPRNSLISDLKDIKEIRFDVMSLFETGIDKELMDVEKVGQAMKDGSVTVNFIYINLDIGKGMSTELKEFSTDIYNAFSKLAGATGGIVETTSKPVVVLKKAVKE